MSNGPELLLRHLPAAVQDLFDDTTATADDGNGSATRCTISAI